MRRTQHINGILDATDIAILQALADDARTPMREVAKRVGLSAPSAAERVRRLEEAGVIGGYRIDIDAAAIGLSLGAYLRIRPMPGELERVAKLLADLPEIIFCDRVTGDDCFIAKAQVAGTAELERLINQLLPYASTNTAVIVSTPVAPRLPAVSDRP